MALGCCCGCRFGLVGGERVLRPPGAGVSGWRRMAAERLARCDGEVRRLRDGKSLEAVGALAGGLGCRYDSRSWADPVGVEWGPSDAVEKNDLVQELDAVVDRLYGAIEAQFAQVYHQDPLDAVLAHVEFGSRHR